MRSAQGQREAAGAGVGALHPQLHTVGTAGSKISLMDSFKRVAWQNINGSTMETKL